jgi:hypothetical protein
MNLLEKIPYLLSSSLTLTYPAAEAHCCCWARRPVDSAWTTRHCQGTAAARKHVHCCNKWLDVAGSNSVHKTPFDRKSKAQLQKIDQVVGDYDAGPHKNFWCWAKPKTAYTLKLLSTIKAYSIGQHGNFGVHSPRRLPSIKTFTIKMKRIKVKNK